MSERDPFPQSLGEFWALVQKHPLATAGGVLFAVVTLILSETGVVMALAMTAYLVVIVPLALLARWSLRRKPHP